jgi:hypothetical protein
MKKVLEYGQLLAFLVIAFFFFDAIKTKLKAKFFTEDTKAVDIAKANIDRAFSAGSTKIEQSIDLTQQNFEDKATEKTASNNITRDPNLIGRWYEQTPYKSGSLNTETCLTFFEDGTMMQTTQSHGTLQGYDTESTIINDKVVDPQLQAAMEKGFRWSSQNGRICRVAPDGHIMVCDMAYEFENQYLFIQIDGYKKPHAYTRAN